MASPQSIYLEKKCIEDIQPGDLIELSRKSGLYAHWTVYVGNGDVIHLAPPPSKSPEITEIFMPVMAARNSVVSSSAKVFVSAKVRRDPLYVVANGSAIVVNNECDDEMRPRKDIVRRAESKLGTGDYNLLTWNCEHFATWCRYGKGVSKQVPFGDSLSKTAYLVQLLGHEVVPLGSLPLNIFASQDSKKHSENWAFIPRGIQFNENETNARKTGGFFLI